MQVPFFSDDAEEPSTPKADALFIPRENPRALVIRPTEQWPVRASAEKASALKNISTPVYEDGKICSHLLPCGFWRNILGRRNKEPRAKRSVVLWNLFQNSLKMDSFELSCPHFVHGTS